MFLHAAALGDLLDMKPASAKHFTKLIPTLAVGSASFSSQQNAFEIFFLTGCLCVVGVCVVRHWSLRQADHSSREVLPTL
jgi:hypothetical protein